MKMLAAVMYEQGLPPPFSESRPFRIEEVELSGPGEGEVLVEVRGAGLCHSDLSVVQGQRPRPLPIVGGHEGAGIVREVGKGVVGFRPGDHVAMAAVAGCGQCKVCLSGRPGLCTAVSAARNEGLLATGVRRLQLKNGDKLNHYSGISVFAQYAVVVPNSLVKIDSRVAFDVAALFGCAVVTGAGAVFNSARVRAGSTVAVIGLGGVGLTTVMAAREAGASKIIGLDLLTSKFDLARAVGATDCIDASTELAVQQVRDLTGGGADYTFEISGSLAALDMAQKITARGGEVVGVGLGKAGALFNVNHLQWIAEERVMRGSLMGGGDPKVDIPKYVDLYLRGQMPVDRLRSDQISFDQLNSGFDQLSGGEVVRQILLPHGAL